MSQTREQNLETVTAVLARLTNYEPEKVTEDTTVDELDLDSLGLVELTMEVEKALQISIPDAKAEGIRSVKDLIDIIQEVQ